MPLSATAALRRLLPRPARRALRRAFERSGGPVVQLHLDGLRRSGWTRSARTGKPVDGDGSPVPWYTYGAIDFLASRLPPSARVFEYGAGHSTLWYAARCAEVVSVEHEPDWARAVSGMVPANATVVLRAEGEGYAAEIDRHPGEFDVVVVDGVDRLACAAAAVGRLSAGGVLVWDNSEEAVFAEARRSLGALGEFRELRFSGFGPCCPWTWSTSVLYRPGNCLSI